MSSYGLWLSAAGMKVNQHRQNLLAHNMANANTTGFKHDLAVVLQRPVESASSPAGMTFLHPVLEGLAGGVNVRPNYQSFAQGPIEWTGRPLDVAIQGEGFFAVSDGGVSRYTRDGQFAVSSDGELVLSAGGGRWRVLDEEGATVEIDRNGGPLSIAEDGSVRQGRTAVAKIGLWSTDDKQSLRKVGENLFEARGVEMVAVEGALRSESREASNFDVMDGLVTMVEAARAYQLNATMVQLHDDLTGQAVDRVGRVA
jgi:flagellar basal body rod protein FlgG